MGLRCNLRAFGKFDLSLRDLFGLGEDDIAQLGVGWVNGVTLIMCETTNQSYELADLLGFGIGDLNRHWFYCTPEIVERFRHFALCEGLRKIGFYGNFDLPDALERLMRAGFVFWFEAA